MAGAYAIQNINITQNGKTTTGQQNLFYDVKKTTKINPMVLNKNQNVIFTKVVNNKPQIQGGFSTSKKMSFSSNYAKSLTSTNPINQIVNNLPVKNKKENIFLSNNFSKASNNLFKSGGFFN